MTDKEMPKISVGDKLAFKRGYGSTTWNVATVTKITPSGRIVCGKFMLNPDLTVRGADRYGPYRAFIPDEQIMREYTRQRNTSVIQRANLKALTDDTLSKIASLIRDDMKEPQTDD